MTNVEIKIDEKFTKEFDFNYFENFCLDEILSQVKKKYPGWVVQSVNKYSKDYPHLNKNWEILCNKLVLDTQQILLVEDRQEKELYAIAEYLTRKGFIVRREEEFVVCDKCSSALPSEKVYDIMVEKAPGLLLPDEWLNHCKGC